MEKATKSNSRCFAFTAITLSTVAITFILIMYPLLFHYLQTLDSSIQVDLDLCKSRSKDMWSAMLDVHSKKYHVKNNKLIKLNDFNKKSLDRSIRRDDPKSQASSSTAVSNNCGSMVAIHSVDLGCCTCNHGFIALQGPPGRDGVEGARGEPGQPGAHGEPAPADPSILANNEECTCTEPDPQGGAGLPGSKGPDEPLGDTGPNGADGKSDAQGLRGPQGDKGKDGLNGVRGQSGDAGKQVIKVGQIGQPYGTGRNGNPGPQGPPGTAGRDRQSGFIGAQGDPGLTGVKDYPCNPGLERYSRSSRW